MASRRTELINQPLARIWGELAKACNEIYEAEAREAYERFTKMQVLEMDAIPKCITFNALVRWVHNASIEAAANEAENDHGDCEVGASIAAAIRRMKQ